MGKKLWLFIACTLLSASMAFAQKTVTGKVIEAATGEPVIGASVKVEGTSVGQATDLNGQFTIQNVPSSAKNLVVSYVGLKTKVVPIKDNQNIFMETLSQALDQVFVVAYGTATKETFTGAASHIEAEAIQDRQISNITNALAGNVAGVTSIKSNGQPGTGSTIYIRGFGSLNAGMSPLYVVNGVPYDGDISAINPQDIEQISVQKDAAATALYGSRAANGVILVTTKKGVKNQAAKITFDASLGSNSREIKNYDVISNPAEFMETLYKAEFNDARYTLGYTAPYANAYANGKFTSALGYPVYTTPAGESLIGLDGRINPNATLGYNDGTNYYLADDWADEMIKNGFRQEYNIGISGGTDNMNYYVSAGYLNDDGVIKHSSFERITTRADIDYQLKKWLKIGTNLAYTNSISNYPDDQLTTTSSVNTFFIANNIAPIYPLYVRNADGTIAQSHGQPVYDYGDGKYTPYTRNWMSISNPLGDLVNRNEAYKMDIFNAQWYATVTPLQGLDITARLGLHIDNTRYDYASSPYFGQAASYGGEAMQEHIRNYSLTQQYLANYKHQFAELHSVAILAGYESTETNEEWSRAYGQNLYKVGDYTVNNAIDERRGYGAYDESAFQKVLAKVNYDYDEKYFGSISWVREGCSYFHPDNRWGSFWSASAAWNLGKEQFLENVGWIDFLKLRASFGQTGNASIQNSYAYLDQYSVTGADGVFSDGTLAYKGNKELTWEKTNAFDIGFDFEFFNGKLSGSIEYFNRTSKDMLYNKPVAPSNGYSSIPMNIGSMRNYGLEIDLTSNLINQSNFFWSVSANATFLKNKVVELAPELKGQLISGDFIYNEGESRYQMYLVKYAGVDKTTGQALYWAKPKVTVTDPETGEETSKYEGEEYTTTDWTTANASNRQSTGDILPTMTGGFGTTLKYHGFDFAIQCSYQLGGKIYDSGYQSLMHGGSTSDIGQTWHKDIAGAWTPENSNTDIPRLCVSDKYTNSKSDRWLISSNYLSLNNITLGYTIPQTLTRTFDVESIRLFASADNVAILSARKGLDPRMSVTSVTTSVYTALRSISFGVKVAF